MYVSTHHAIIALCACMLRGKLLELLDVAHARSDAELEPLRKRPVRPPECTAQVVHRVVQSEHRAVEHVAEARQPARCAQHAVEQIAMQHEQPLTALADAPR